MKRNLTLKIKENDISEEEYINKKENLKKLYEEKMSKIYEKLRM